MATKVETDALVHPGEFLRDELEALGMTQKALAEKTGRPARLINEICREKRAITPATALDLEEALGIAATSWLNLQQRYDLTLAKRERAARREREAARA